MICLSFQVHLIHCEDNAETKASAVQGWLLFLVWFDMLVAF